MARRNANFSLAVKTEGGLLPVDFLLKMASLSKEIEGLSAEQYYLSDREKINEAINRAYSRLQGFWLSFKDAMEKLPPDDYATSATKEKWLLPLFDCLGYGRLLAAEAIVVGDRQYKPSHIRSNVPIHLVGFRVDLDKRSTAGGARVSSPHSLVQELLNQSDKYLWAFLSNGRKLRLLRDNVSLTKQAFIEFDLESIFEGDGYSDFRLLWLLCHQSRVEGTPPESCWLEKWKDTAQRSGIRIRDQLRAGVEKALEIFGTGFLRHRTNDALRTKIRSGEINADEYYRQLMRLIYRLLFLFVTEDKGVLLRSEATIAQRKTYYDYYSTTRLRAVAGKRRGTQHEDLWANLSFVFEKLSSDNGCTELGLPALGSFLWSAKATPAFDQCRLYNADLLEGLRHLCFTIDSGVRRPVQYGQLESEELGSIYESLLEQIPFLDASGNLPTFALRQTAGSERKTTGSYYTPTSLVNCLLDSALEPVLNQVVRRPNPESAILNLKICDPACGSGHFLIAAAHRVAKRLASVRSGDMEPGPEFTNTALREVISRCIYGVDVNEMAVELCKVSLWLQSAVAGVPLSFLDHKIKCGNSLLGTTPILIDKGLPDAALDAIEGDDKETVRLVKAANKGQTDAHIVPGFLKDEGAALEELASTLATIDLAPDSAIGDVHTKEQKYAELLESESYIHEKYICDAWCAAFVWKLAPNTISPITREVFGRIRSDYHNISKEVRDEIIRLRQQYKFFHWHLEFPQVFLLSQLDKTENNSGFGGFDIVLGNPPWERVKLQEQEWFAPRAPEIAQARTASIRGKMIADLKRTNPHLLEAFLEDRRQAEGESHISRKSNRFPLCGRGDVNTYALFAELNTELVRNGGLAGFIVQSDIATGDTYKYFFGEMMQSKRLVSFHDFVNTEGLFPSIHRTHPHFCLITLGSPGSCNEADFTFWNTNANNLLEPDRHLRLSASDISLLNPNTNTCPIFRTRKDAEITKKIYSQVPVLIKEGPPEENPWGMKFSRLFDMSNDSGLFRSKAALETSGFKLTGNIFEKVTASNITAPDVLASDIERFLPLYEGKMIHHFDHRWATYDYSRLNSKDEPETRDVTIEEKQDPNFVVLPRHWVAEAEVKARLAGKWEYPWLLGWRDITNSTNERTVISTLMPLTAVGHTCPLMFLPKFQHLAMNLAANLSSHVLDYIARQKIGGTHLTYSYLMQLPVLAPSVYEDKCPWEPQLSLEQWFLPRLRELFFTSTDLLDWTLDKTAKPHCWSDERRYLIKCEIDAAFFHLYKLSEEDLIHILNQFPILRNTEEKSYGEFRKLRQILEIFRMMGEAMNNGAKPLETALSRNDNGH